MLSFPIHVVVLVADVEKASHYINLETYLIEIFYAHSGSKTLILRIRNWFLNTSKL